MNKDLAEFYINYCLDGQIDFAELFYEEKEVNEVKLINSKIDKSSANIQSGLGIRLSFNNKISYGDISINEKDKILDMINSLKENYGKKRILDIVKLTKKEHKINFIDKSIKWKKDLLYTINSKARRFDKRVKEVSITLSNVVNNVIIASSKGKYVKDTRINTLLVISVIVKEKESTANSSQRFGYSDDYSFIQDINLDSEIEKIVINAISQLQAKPMKGGMMPVVIGPAFGAVIFHEAVGHALEATTVSTKLSVLSNKYNKKIATEKVTLIDDGTLKKLWGTTYYDDEGNKTQKNILINKGILSSYLIDELNSMKMKMKITGSGRRQSYRFIPTSRMNNTYLLPGNDKIEDMIESIDYGLYAKEMGGGSVDPITGNFNFAVNEGYVIRKGKICEPIKLVSLIGNTLDIMKEIEMVSDNLDFGVGFCGSTSGLIYTTIGQPTIKVSKILVGGGK